jgi:hypothetical protein
MWMMLVWRKKKQCCRKRDCRPFTGRLNATQRPTVLAL